MAKVVKKKGTKSAGTKENKRPKNLQVDFTGVEGRKGSRRIKEGDYLFKVTDYEVGKKKEEEKTKRWVIFKFDILKGPSKGAFSDLFGLAKNQLWRYRLFLEAAGIEISSGVNDVRLDKLIGKKVAGTVEDDTYNGKTKSQVSDYFSASDYEELAAEEDEDEDEDADEDDEDADEDDEDEDVADAATDDDEDEDDELEVVDDDDI